MAPNNRLLKARMLPNSDARNANDESKPTLIQFTAAQSIGIASRDQNLPQTSFRPCGESFRGRPQPNVLCGRGYARSLAFVASLSVQCQKPTCHLFLTD